jgi:hypothetical protein
MTNQEDMYPYEKELREGNLIDELIFSETGISLEDLSIRLDLDEGIALTRVYQDRENFAPFSLKNGIFSSGGSLPEDIQIPLESRHIFIKNRELNTSYRQMIEAQLPRLFKNFDPEIQKSLVFLDQTMALVPDIVLFFSVRDLSYDIGTTSNGVSIRTIPNPRNNFLWTTLLDQKPLSSNPYPNAIPLDELINRYPHFSFAESLKPKLFGLVRYQSITNLAQIVASNHLQRDVWYHEVKFHQIYIYCQLKTTVKFQLREGIQFNVQFDDKDALIDNIFLRPSLIICENCRNIVPIQTAKVCSTCAKDFCSECAKDVKLGLFKKAVFCQKCHQ